MRHRQKTQNFSRFSSYYKATIRSLARAVILHQSIITTSVRAKMARQTVDNLITMGKKADSLAARREAYAVLCDHKLVVRLFSEVAPMFTERKGGYTRIIPYKRRRGDNAELVVLELSSQKVGLGPGKSTVEKEEEKKRTSERVRTAIQADTAKDAASPEAVEEPKKTKGGIGKLFKKKSE